MPNTDYTTVADTLTAIKMVYNRLKFLTQSVDNDTIIKEFIFEFMHELEPCFKVGDGNVGKEQYYTTLQLSIIADLVAAYMLLGIVAANSQDSSGNQSSLRYLKRAKAGSAETEWAHVAVKESNALFINADNLVSYYKKDAARKARGIGCILDICDDCTVVGGITGVFPAITITYCGCRC